MSANDEGIILRQGPVLHVGVWDEGDWLCLLPYGYSGALARRSFSLALYSVLLRNTIGQFRPLQRRGYMSGWWAGDGVSGWRCLWRCLWRWCAIPQRGGPWPSLLTRLRLLTYLVGTLYCLAVLNSRACLSFPPNHPTAAMIQALLQVRPLAAIDGSLRH